MRRLDFRPSDSPARRAGQLDAMYGTVCDHGGRLAKVEQKVGTPTPAPGEPTEPGDPGDLTVWYQAAKT